MEPVGRRKRASGPTVIHRAKDYGARQLMRRSGAGQHVASVFSGVTRTSLHARRDQSASVYECFPFICPYNALLVEVGSPNSPEVLFWSITLLARSICGICSRYPANFDLDRPFHHDKHATVTHVLVPSTTARL